MDCKTLLTSSVKKAVNTETGQEVAIKILDKEEVKREDLGESIKKEVTLMKMIKHKNVVRLIEVLASNSKIYIVLELVRGGDLFDAIKGNFVLFCSKQENRRVARLKVLPPDHKGHGILPRKRSFAQRPKT